MKVKIKRVYDEPAERDGVRILVDRLWPRGLSKDDARLDAWAKNLAPSTALRQWFNHDPERFSIFAERYHRELAENQAKVDEFLDSIGRRKTLTLLYAAKNPAINHAIVLKDFLATGE